MFSNIVEPFLYQSVEIDFNERPQRKSYRRRPFYVPPRNSLP
jgi:hypothetical protein